MTPVHSHFTNYLDVVTILGGVGEGDGASLGRSRTNLAAGGGRKDGSGVSGGKDVTGRGVVNSSAMVQPLIKPLSSINIKAEHFTAYLS